MFYSKITTKELCFRLLVRSRKIEIDYKLNDTETGEEPVEVIEMPAVQVIAEPALSEPCRRLVDDGDQESADKISDAAKGTQIERDPEASQYIMYLVVEELL